MTNKHYYKLYLRRQGGDGKCDLQDWPPEGRPCIVKDSIELIRFTLGGVESLGALGVEPMYEGLLSKSGTSLVRFDDPNGQSILEICFLILPIIDAH